MNTTYEQLQTGDEIGLNRSNGYGGDVMIVKVQRRTKTHVIIGPLYVGGESYAFSAKDGVRVGKKHYRDWELYPLASAQEWLAKKSNKDRVRSEIDAALANMGDHWTDKGSDTRNWLQDPETRAKAIAKLRAVADTLEQIK
mgnify:CR=1 FL=1